MTDRPTSQTILTKTATLPDGRKVEVLDYVLIDHYGDHWIVDVYFLIGVDEVGCKRVEFDHDGGAACVGEGPEQ